MNLLDIEREITSLKSWATKQGFGNSLQANRYGDVRVVWGEDNKPYLEASTNRGVVSSFVGAFKVKGLGRPELELENLYVKNLFAEMFSVKQTNGTNGDLLVSDSAIVEGYTKDTITFKDPTNLRLCPFVVNDTCIIKRIKYDKSLTIRETCFTVTAVNNNTVTVSYSTAVDIEKGDIVVRTGNTSVLARQNLIYLAINETSSPYMDLYSGLTTATAYQTATPKVRVGNLSGITDADFGGALTGYGFYGQDVYLKGKLKINNVSDIIGLPTIITTYRQTATPSTPKTGDLWYDTTAGEIILKRYNGSTWDAVGVDGTYIDSNGIYTGTLVAQNIIAGTGLVANLSVLSTLTMGSAVTDGYIQSYGWNGTANGFQIKGGATPSVSLIGGTITSGTIQTATGTGQRVVLSGSTNDLKFYNSSNSNILSITGNVGTGSPGMLLSGGAIYLDGVGADASYTNITSNQITVNASEQNNITGTFYNTLSSASLNVGLVGAAYAGTPGTITQSIGLKGDASGGVESFGVVGALTNITGGTTTNYGIYGSAASATTNWAGYFNDGNVYVKNELQIGSNKFTVNSSGQLTKINNLAASSYTGYVLGSDGTSYTALSLTANDFNYSAGAISIDYTNGQAASTSNKGFLTNTDWNTFNGKVGLGDNNVFTGSVSYTPDAFTLTVTATISATAKKTVSVTPTVAYDNLTTISDGTDGQELTIVNVNGTYNVLIDEGGNIYNGGATITLTQYETASYVYINGLTKWVLKSTTGATA